MQINRTWFAKNMTIWTYHESQPPSVIFEMPPCNLCIDHTSWLHAQSTPQWETIIHRETRQNMKLKNSTGNMKIETNQRKRPWAPAAGQTSDPQQSLDPSLAWSGPMLLILTALVRAKMFCMHHVWRDASRAKKRLEQRARLPTGQGCPWVGVDITHLFEVLDAM